MTKQRVLILLLLVLAPLASLAQTPTTFTYQGRLYNGGALANGSHMLRIRPFNQATSGSPLAAAVTTPALNVVDGIFSTSLDFGSSVFVGGPVWLEIEVQAPASGFVPLTPRQPVTPTPYAINADKLDGLDATQVVNVNRDFADFFAIFPDNIATIQGGGDVLFPQNGPASAGIVRTSTSTFLLPAIGIYQILFEVSVDEPGQLVLTLNGVELPNTVVGRAIGSSQIVGMSVIETTQVSSLLTVRNPAGNSPSLTVTPWAGGLRPVSAHLVITQLR